MIEFLLGAGIVIGFLFLFWIIFDFFDYLYGLIKNSINEKTMLKFERIFISIIEYTLTAFWVIATLFAVIYSCYGLGSFVLK